MGLGFLVKAEVRARGLLRRRPGRDRVFSDLCQSIRDCTADPLMAKMIRTSVEAYTLSVFLHPCAEPVEFLWEPDSTIQASAKTSTVGPGYHAYLVDLLNRVGAALN